MFYSIIIIGMFNLFTVPISFLPVYVLESFLNIKNKVLESRTYTTEILLISYGSNFMKNMNLITLLHTLMFS